MNRRLRMTAAIIAVSQGAAYAQDLNPADAGVAVEETGDVVYVSARRVQENVKDVPIPLSVVSGAEIERTGNYNLNRLKELQPTLQFYTSNPRNSAINIRGLGSPYGLTNDGIEPGVGVYIDDVYIQRPAAVTFDFVDLQQIEILRGPQGTLYGKNTTSGAINITTRAPSFEAEGRAEISYGNYGFLQAKASISGPLIGDVVAGRLSFSGTHRDGMVFNVLTNDDVNDQNNFGLRGQILVQPSDDFKLTLRGDYNQQRSSCCTQVFVEAAPTLRNPNRQFEAMAAELGYAPPSRDPFDRLTDVDTEIRGDQNFGGASAVAEWKVGAGTLTSITAWRFWDWDPSNDRDFIGLPITTVSANPSKQHQYTQELRYAGPVTESLDVTAGLFAFHQTIDSNNNQTQGSAAARWLLAPAPENIPALLDGLTQTGVVEFDNTSLAAFAQATWSATDRLRIVPGIRLNYDKKD